MLPEPQITAAGQTNATLVDRSLPSDFRWVRRAIHETLDILRADGQRPQDVDTIEIILAEALNNVVEHAYEGEEGKGEIRLNMRKRGSSLMIEIRDRGRPMPNGRVPVGNHPMCEFNPKDAMPEGGYGWFLIRELVLDLIYDRKDGENILFMTYRTGER
jgi:serine/threonine-protein kinase RsbW